MLSRSLITQARRKLASHSELERNECDALYDYIEALEDALTSVQDRCLSFPTGWREFIGVE